jgi:nucleotide-binding universal stress UspA family protein
MIKRILVGLGGTEYATTATNHAVALALAHNAELTGVSVLDEVRLTATGPVPLGGSHYAHQLAEYRLIRGQELLEWSVKQFEEACQQAGVRYNVVRDVGEPFSLMIKEARYHDLMVFGLRSIFEFDLVPDPQDSLVRLVQSGVRPLLAVPPGFHQIKKVLIAYSGSMESAKTMKHFMQLRLWPQSQIRIVSFEDGGRNAEKLVEEAANYCRAHEFAVETECVQGSPKAKLLSYAKDWGADLTVIGNSAKNLLLRRIFGETALHAIRNSDLPLFLAQ